MGAELPLPRSEAEFEELRAQHGVNVVLDATDMDEDGIWVDSSGNVVEYLAELWYPHGSYISYTYLATGIGGPGQFPPTEAEFVYKALSKFISRDIVCFKPVLEPPTPPTPVKGKTLTLVLLINRF